MVLMLSFGFFGSVRQLMNATHSALAGVSAADKVEKLLAIDTARPYRPDLPAEDPALCRHSPGACFLPLSGQKRGFKECVPGYPEGKGDGACGAFRQRKIHHCRPYDAVLRSGAGTNPAGGEGYRQPDAGGAAQADPSWYRRR